MTQKMADKRCEVKCRMKKAEGKSNGGDLPELLHSSRDNFSAMANSGHPFYSGAYL